MQTRFSCPSTHLKGIILGGPGPTKYDFEKGDYLNYQLKNKILDVVDTAYVEEQGVKEVVDKAPEIMKKVRYIEEKEIMQKFLYEVGHDTALITYGEAEVRRLAEYWRSADWFCCRRSWTWSASPSNAAHAATKSNTPSKAKIWQISRKA